jgi:hypothetical protein
MISLTIVGGASFWLENQRNLLQVPSLHTTWRGLFFSLLCSARDLTMLASKRCLLHCKKILRALPTCPSYIERSNNERKSECCEVEW